MGELVDYQIVVYLEWMNEAIAIAKRPAAEHKARWIAWQARADRIMQTSVEKFTVVLPILLSPAVPATGTAFLRYQSELGTTVILIAAERHRRKTGKWPAAIFSRAFFRTCRSTRIRASRFKWNTAMASSLFIRLARTVRMSMATIIRSSGPNWAMTTWGHTRGTYPCAGGSCSRVRALMKRQDLRRRLD